jgi:mannose-1-phosphate guanylyltransferase
METHIWSIVLAGGKGTRLSQLTRGTPKQFWRPRGGASLIEETLTRLAPICSGDRTVVVVDESQRQHMDGQPIARARCRVVFQPADRGTAAGVLFGLIAVLDADPQAMVLITPADHGVRQPEVFRRSVVDAAAHVRVHDTIVLFGVEARSPQTDYGWMTLAGESASARIHRVSSFVEKPTADIATRLFSAGAAWNTMVIVARARALLDVFRAQIPDVACLFVGALTLRPSTRTAFLASRYPRLPSRDFSRDVLAGAAGLDAYIWPASIGWSDLGTPQRLTQWFAAPALAARHSHPAT